MSRVAWLMPLFVVLVVAFVTSAGAQEIGGPTSHKAARAVAGGTGVGVGVRALGMGGAYTGLANDVSALYWNPAGLPQKRGASGGLMVGAKARGIDVISDARDLEDAVRDAEIDLGDFEDLRDIALRLRGRPASATGGALVGFGFSGVGIGAFGEGSVDAVLNYEDLRDTTGFEQVDVSGSSTWYYSFGAGMSREIRPELNVGAGLRRVTAGWAFAEYSATYDGNTVTDDAVTTDFEDSNFALDVGMQTRRDEQTTVGVMIRNLNSPSFTFRDAQIRRKMRMEPCLNIGVARHMDEYTLAADVHNLLNANGAGQTLHLGAEWRPVKALAVRAGLHDGDFAFGLGFALGPLNIELAADPRFKKVFALQLLLL